MLQNRPILFPRRNRNREKIHALLCIDRLKPCSRAFDVRVLPSCTKRYFVQCQSVVTAVSRSSCDLVMRMWRRPGSTRMPTWKSRYRRWTGQGPRVSSQASSARLHPPIIAPRLHPITDPLITFIFSRSGYTSFFVIHPISSEDTTRNPCRYGATHNEERQ